MANMHTLELLVTMQKGCGNLVTFAHMVAIACFSAVENIDWDRLRLKPRKIPLGHYVVLVLLFFVVQTLNNKAFAYDISIPLHMVFRSGSVIASLVVGSLLLNKQYSLKTVIAVLVTTAGVVLLSLASAPANADKQVSIGSWLTGVSIMSTTLFVTALMGAYQEKMYAQLKLHKSEVPWQETLFYTHLLSIPVFVLVAGDVYRYAVLVVGHCDRVIVPTVGPVPRGGALLLMNVCTQYLCIRGVYQMIAVTSSLNCSFVLNLRKFLSTVLSIWLFEHQFGWLHGFGATLVVVGTAFYTHCQWSESQPTSPKLSSTLSNHTRTLKLTSGKLHTS